MKKGILLILDGYGEGKPSEYNAVENANTPFLHALKQQPISLIKTDGEAVGIFKGEMGGSEVGHMTIGAGRIVNSTAKQIYDDVKSGEFKKNKLLLDVLNYLKNEGGNLHLLGMMSDKNIHSNIQHAYQIIDLAKDKVKNIFLHLYTDGRDTPPYDSLKYIKDVKNHIKNIKNCEIASICGRFYSMDRENNLDRTKMAYHNMFVDYKQIEPDKIEEYLKNQHSSGKNDQFIEPIHIKTKANFALNNKDVILMFNFREDRVRQLAKMCKEQANCRLVTMANVGDVESVVLYHSASANHTFSEYLSSLNLRQIKISESTKYAHVTYFLNGGREEPFSKEDRIHIPSLKIDDFAKTPKMRAPQITKEVLNSIKKGYDAIIVNYSNPDMIGHTGDYNAVVKALECLDKCIKKVVNFALKNDYFLIITADHGNAECMKTTDGQPHMAHTLNRVFLTVVDNKNYKLKKYGGLYDIAPTFLDLMGAEPYKYFEGQSLILK